ncbi:MAG: ParB N-terminal domain-containing protein [Legionella sp.]|uniref:ParB/RepB/Spo0J family partition protein n=1 Tax=Legionella sp. TaxID=459 RepID=UPI0039E36A38
MTMILGNNNFDDIASEEKKNVKRNASKGDASKALNFGNISMQLSFNDGGFEGYYKVRPKALKPSTHNPRPDWIIDDEWLVKHVGIDMSDVLESNDLPNCLVKIEENEVDGKIVEVAHFPDFSTLFNNPNKEQQKEYEFLVDLAKSLRETGQIQPIEIESDSEGNTLIVLEGHLRRLACILGRIPYIRAIRNEGLHDLSTREKIGRQITENSLRANVSPFGNYQLAIEEIKANPSITVRELRERLKIKKDFAAVILKMILNPEKFHPIILDSLKRGMLSANNLIKVAAITRADKQESFIHKLLKNNKVDNSDGQIKPLKRGTDGRKKSVATFSIKTHDHCVKAGKKLLELLPQLKQISNINQVESVEDFSMLLKSFESFLLDKV